MYTRANCLTAYLKKLGQVGEDPHLHIINVLGAVFLKGGEEVMSGHLLPHNVGYLVEGVGQHPANLPLQRRVQNNRGLDTYKT